VVSEKGDSGDDVTPEGKLERVTLTVWLKPFIGVRVMFAVALWPASMDNTEGATPIEKLAGGGDMEEVEPPPQLTKTNMSVNPTRPAN
jgi:hypothetical protein